MGKRKRAIVSFCSVMGVIIIIVVSVLVMSWHSEKEELKKRKERLYDGERMEALLHKRELSKALRLVDTLHHKYPNDPQFYFVEGWAYYMNGDSVNARQCYQKSLCIYDSLLAEREDMGDRCNRAYLVYLLYGKSAFYKAVDEMASLAKTHSDSMAVNFWKQADPDKDFKQENLIPKWKSDEDEMFPQSRNEINPTLPSKSKIKK